MHVKSFHGSGEVLARLPVRGKLLPDPDASALLPLIEPARIMREHHSYLPQTKLLKNSK